MDEFTPAKLLEQLRQLDEQPRIEAKRASDIGKSVMQTICAFANEPGLGGGYLLLGIDEPKTSDETFHVCGVTDADRLLNSIQSNCREQFEAPIPVQGEVAQLEGKKVIRLFVPELEPAAKPCTFKGKFDSKNKRKTGVWRRGLNGDYECSQHELEPLLLAKSGMNYEQVILPDAEWDDLDPSAIALYRTLRAKVRPYAEELQASDHEMLYALNLVKKQGDKWVPNIAGLLLMGKPLALRRLLPAVRVDYVRINGTQWVEDPEQRFAITLDIRESLLRLIPKLEATISDDLPRHFRLKDGSTQRNDEPLLPHKVIREAVVNAVMHRDYQVNQPILVVRYSNRIEIRNAGYSLKPEIALGDMGSKLRNPVIAAVLYDLSFAETKGSGIKTMRRLLEQAGLTAPVFISKVIENEFVGTYLLHQLLGEEQLSWLQQFAELHLTDHEAKALLLAKETGAVDNAGLRAISGLDTLSASQLLRKLHYQYRLLEQGGAGPATYYQLAQPLQNDDQLSLFPANDAATETSNTSDLIPNTSDLTQNTSDLIPNTSEFSVPNELTQRIEQLTSKARKDKLWPIIVWLCALHPYKAEQLATQLARKETPLKHNHLNVLREQEGLIDYLYPEVVNHPNQAYLTTAKGLQWLKAQGIDIGKGLS
ncbi:ATP-binding protein [Celerinatantimonas diazotrophica]|uniref:ATP-dependent DNA helicase RecG n=1 Tax=Celerinatantimonas diazotrophica TaxID=412034 RepID=A0A4R1JAB4_9GAMM|nr:ATP-binding protein [Celerinatantimonas diazotrophica]TCK47417.1 ATP-dependent DNA helicase RecG [Celerinatantimonas diazotrophica]CAG9294965.1 hypothetical protein CEDIAZO_00071 [Celerinatantimonas diazotrophica]